MTTKKESSELTTLSKKVDRHSWLLEERVIPSIDKMEEILEENMGGIKLASLLNSKIITVVLGGIVAAGIWFVAKSGGLN